VAYAAIEHHAVHGAAEVLETLGWQHSVLPSDRNGMTPPESVNEVPAGTTVLALMLANNETGVVQPVAEVARLARACGARVHTDAVQAAGKLSLDVNALGVDLLSLAGHKFHGPAGAAALYVRRRTRLAPLVHGGHQERSRRAGTEALAPIVGLGVAAERARSRVADEGPRVAALTDALREGLGQRIPGVRFHGDAERRLPGILSVGFDGVDGEAVLHELDGAGITVSTGSACSAATPGPSHVLLAMGLTPEQAHATVRFSLGEGNGPEDVGRILEVTPGVVTRLRALDTERRSA